MEENSVILIVDDDPTMLKVLSELFKHLYRIKFAKNGHDALKLAGTGVDLILLDINLPDINGLEVCKTLKNDPLTQAIPIIFVTATLDNILEETGIELGGADFVTKPYSNAILKARVKSHLENKILRDKLETLAMTDSLTGIPNRRLFDCLIEKEWHRSLRSQMPISLLMIDVDHFKSINDQYGHDIGDQVLKMIASVLCKHCHRPSDFAARIGGEEFSILLPDTHPAGAYYIAESIRKHIESVPFYNASTSRFAITISIGIASVVPESLESIKTFIKQADTLLYQAKNNGRNQVCQEPLNSHQRKTA